VNVMPCMPSIIHVLDLRDAEAVSPCTGGPTIPALLCKQAGPPAALAALTLPGFGALQQSPGSGASNFNAMAGLLGKQQCPLGLC
jgi:hypothetical protein